jgi:hypothetical protein
MLITCKITQCKTHNNKDPIGQYFRILLTTFKINKQETNYNTCADLFSVTGYIYYRNKTI